MNDAWEDDYEVFVEDAMSRENAKSGMLSAHLTVLLTKGLIAYQTPVDEVQQALKERYNVEYEALDISGELTCMRHIAESDDSDVLIQDDYYPGH